YWAALDRAGKLDKVADGADRARREVVQELRGSLWTLATMGAVMPFVGLFGTVVGILASFGKLQNAGGMPGCNIVAGDISEALITTAGGILVAVEAVVFYNYFQAKVARKAFH